MAKTVSQTATSSISNMSSPLKAMLMGADSVDRFAKTLDDASKSSDSSISDSAKELVQSFNDLRTVIRPVGVKMIQGRIVDQLQTERGDTTPARVAAHKQLRYDNAQLQQEIQDSISKSRSLERIFVNSGSLKAGNALDVRSFLTQQSLNQSMLGISQRTANTGVYKLRFGEGTVAQYESATELKRIAAERTAKVESVRTDATRNIVGMLTQNFESKIHQPELYKDAYMPGGSAPSISDFNEKFLEALNKGISTTVKNGNVSTDIPTLMKTIAANSGGNQQMQNNVQRYLNANSSDELLKALLDVNRDVAKIDQESLVEAIKQNISLQGLKSELLFKQQSSYLGGVSSITDRHSRRQLEQDFSRGTKMNVWFTFC